MSDTPRDETAFSIDPHTGGPVASLQEIEAATAKMSADARSSELPSGADAGEATSSPPSAAGLATDAASTEAGDSLADEVAKALAKAK